MNKIFKFMLVFAASAFLFAACDKPEPEPTPDPNGGTTEEVCDKCGKNPCECEEQEVPEPTTPDWCDYYFVCDFTISETDGDFGKVDYNTLTNAEGKTIAECLGYESFAEVAAAVAGEGGDPFGTTPSTQTGEVTYIGYDLGSESDILADYNTWYLGYWVGANGAVANWGTEDCRFYTQGYADDNDVWAGVDLGVFTANIKVGDKYQGAMIFQKNGDELVRVGIQFNINVIEYQDPEAGQYSGTATVGTFDVDYEATMTLSTHEFDYDGPSFDDFTAVQEKLGMTKFELSNAFAEGYVADDEGALYTGLMIEVVLPDGTTYEGTNVWVNADNAKTDWGAADAAVCFDLYVGATYFEAGACAMPSYYEVPEGQDPPTPNWYYGDGVKAAVGKTIKNTYRITYVPADDLGVAAADPTIININLAVTVAE